jgi:hypothetical protein
MRRLGIRNGISAGLIVIVAMILIVARLVDDDRTATDSSRPGQVPSVNASAGDDGPIMSTPTPYSDDGEVRAAADAFIRAWLQRSLGPQEWHAGLVPLVTRSLAESLEGVDPVVVPATRITGEATLALRSDLYALLNVPVDSGMVELGLLKRENVWLVDSVDWQRA